MNSLPIGWVIADLGMLTQTKSGNSKLIKGKLSAQPTRDASIPAFSASGQDVWTAMPEHSGDAVIVSAVGARCGKAFLASGEWSAIANTHIVWPKLGFLNVRFLWYRINDENFWVKGGSAQPFVKVAATFELPFSLPPAPEQKRIADKLDSILTRVDAVKTSLASVSPTLKRFRQSVLAAATSGRLTEDWRATATAQSAAGELVQYLAQRAKKEKKPPAQPDMAHWKRSVPANWTIASVQQFAECLDRLRVPIKRDQRQSEMGLYPYYGANGEVGRIDQFIFDDELVLVTEDETFYGREKPIAYRSSGKCWVNNHAHVLRAPSKAANDYLCFSLMYYDVVPWLSGTTGRAKLTQQALNSLPIAVPPALEISEIVRRVETLFAFADRLEARLQVAQAAATRLTPSLLAKAFRGELVTQDPNDEPASKLLKRLAASTPGTVIRKTRSKITS